MGLVISAKRVPTVLQYLYKKTDKQCIPGRPGLMGSFIIILVYFLRVSEIMAKHLTSVLS